MPANKTYRPYSDGNITVMHDGETWLIGQTKHCVSPNGKIMGRHMTKVDASTQGEARNIALATFGRTRRKKEKLVPVENLDQPEFPDNRLLDGATVIGRAVAPIKAECAMDRLPPLVRGAILLARQGGDLEQCARLALGE